MQTVTPNLGENSYPIWVDAGLLNSIGELLIPQLNGRQICMVTDREVGGRYMAQVRQSLEHEGFNVVEVVIDGGEDNKTLETVNQILTVLLEARLDRSSALLALGGGVVGDMAGFAAAIYLRGIDVVQVPTTILAQADSSVGGKTGVNHPVGKNLIGAFHQPTAVVIDTDTLKTLPDREIRSGLAEVIKHGIIRDEVFFQQLETDIPQLLSGSLPDNDLVSMTAHNCRIKADVVSIDEKEKGLRAILNYGHTVGHAIEALTEYKRYRHGEAVLFGMQGAGRLGVRLGSWSKADEARQNQLIQQLLTVDPPTDLDADAIANRTRSDKKVRSGQLRFVLPKRIGEVEIVDKVKDSDIVDAWKSVFG